jgi:hypothetical protein
MRSPYLQRIRGDLRILALVESGAIATLARSSHTADTPPQAVLGAWRAAVLSMQGQAYVNVACDSLD